MRFSAGGGAVNANINGTNSNAPMAEGAETHRARSLRRLSLGTALSQVCLFLSFHPPLLTVCPQAPNFSQQDVQQQEPILRQPSPKKMRRKTLAADASSTNKRAPSPMGERILKGHFDGFN